MTDSHPLIALTLIALTLLAPLSLAQGSSNVDPNAVNERIPVSKAEMEAHWQVDCAGAWAGLQHLLLGSSSRKGCEIPEKLRRDIQLCAFIYQAPGDNPESQCPNYQGASEQLQIVGEAADCNQLQRAIPLNGSCNVPTAPSP